MLKYENKSVWHGANVQTWSVITIFTVNSVSLPLNAGILFTTSLTGSSQLLIIHLPRARKLST